MKKRIISVVLCLILLFALLIPAAAAGTGPEITFNPQSPCWPEYAVASYSVRTKGENLRAFWYMEWQGTTYNISDNYNGVEPWEGYAGESYGGIQEDANTFTYFFSGIEADLDGAYIWCVVEDGHYDVESQRVRISVGENATAPSILDFPTHITVYQGDSAEIRCVAKSNDGSQLSFLWYETPSGLLQDIQAVNRGTETSDYMFCDTSSLGTRNYICKVDTDAGGLAYSSVVSVTVEEKVYVPEAPVLYDAQLPDATAGVPYTAKIGCSDPEAKISLYHNPGKANDFDKTGLILGNGGLISGTVNEPGEYTFSLSASGAGGEDYAEYTLKVLPTPVKESETPTPSPEQEQVSPPASAEVQTPAPEKTEAPDEGDKDDSGVPVWTVLLVGIVGVAAGVCVAVLILKKKS